MGRLDDDVTLTFTRFTAGHTINPTTYRRELNTQQETFKASGVLEPVNPSSLVYMLPEGRRVSRAYYFFTDTLLTQGEDTGDRRTADTTSIRGETYEVFSDGDYGQTSNSRLDNYEAVLIKVDEVQS